MAIFETPFNLPKFDEKNEEKENIITENPEMDIFEIIENNFNKINFYDIKNLIKIINNIKTEDDFYEFNAKEILRNITRENFDFFAFIFSELLRFNNVKTLIKFLHFMEKIDRLPYSKFKLNLILETLADDVENADLPVFKLTLKNSEIIDDNIVKIKNILWENGFGALIFVMFHDIIEKDEFHEINFKGLIEKLNLYLSRKKDFKEIHDLIKNYINDPKNKNQIKAKRLNILKELNEFGELLYS